MLKSAMIAILALLPLPAAAETMLLMAEENGCGWCDKWNEEVGHIYPKTPEGRTAPLKRFDLLHDDPNVKLTMRVRFTPTFILVDDGKEVGRIEGYAGDHFFWGLLSETFERAGIAVDDEKVTQ